MVNRFLVPNGSWTKQTIPHGAWSVQDLARLFGVSRWSARRVLVRSGLPATLLRRYWRSPEGTWYARRVWFCNETVATILFAQRQRRTLKRLGRYGRKSALELDAEIARLLASLEPTP